MKGHLLSVWVLIYLLSSVEGQIPSVCAHDGSLRGTERRCCPNDCGATLQPIRGRCVSVNITESSGGDPRVNWPIHYFTHVCRCEYKFGGVDCLSCAYGYYGSRCTNWYIAPRINLEEFSSKQWADYRSILNMTRNTDSEYVAIVDGSNFNPLIGYSSIASEVRNISIYNFFVWTHYLVAKDSERKGEMKKDFAHESTGFLTWHRQMLLWFEWKIQEMLKVNGDSNYYKFRLSYWDWTNQTQRTAPFTQNRLGATLYSSLPMNPNNHIVQDYSQPIDLRLFSNWQTICWGSKKGPDGSPCDPKNSTGKLKRCPRNSCHSNNRYWPTVDQVKRSVDIHFFDYSNYYNPSISNNPCSPNSFRNRLEGFFVIQECNKDVRRMCSISDETTQCNRSRGLHNSVHLILGAGDLRNLETSDKSNANGIRPNDLGVMAHVAASPNDPIFINHHAMIDCIFEEWLMRNKKANYPYVITGKDGHHGNDYIVPFLPLFTHDDMFKRAYSFGYRCDLPYFSSGLATVYVVLISVACSFISPIIIFLLGAYICNYPKFNSSKK